MTGFRDFTRFFKSCKSKNPNRFTLNWERLKEGAQFYRVTADGKARMNDFGILQDFFKS